MESSPPFLMPGGPHFEQQRLGLNVHRIDKGTEDQRGKVTGLRTHSISGLRVKTEASLGVPVPGSPTGLGASLQS